MGLNAPEAELITNIDEAIKLAYGPWKNKEKISIRSFKLGESAGNEPFFPNISTDEEWLPLVDDILAKGYHVILSIGIDPNDALGAGTICVTQQYRTRNYKIEFAFESGTTVREVMNGRVQYRDTVQLPRTSHSCVNQVLEVLKSLGKKADGKLFEVSIYPYGVGYKNQPVIFWEVHEDEY